MKNEQDHLSDAELFAKLRGDKKTAELAFAELYKRHSARIYAYCRRFLGNQEDARDVFQDTFYRFFQAADHERIMTNVPAFLLKIARNLCVNFKRAERKTTTLEDFNLPRIENTLDKEELLELIKSTLEVLNPEYREVFILREYDGLSYEEIAQVTNLTLGTVKIRIYRAKQKIRQILQPYLNDLSKY
jgi:RNA polymerase sigma-70 factor (ECF subfamily)